MATRKHVALSVSALILVLSGLSACSKHEKPNVIYMPDMVWGPSLKAQEEGAMRMPVKGTIPRDYVPYGYRDVESAGRELTNPLRPTEVVLKRGQAIYNTYCIVCHGPSGEGDGSVVPKFPRPPTLQSDKVRSYPDGSIYHVITMGQNLMPSYASQIGSADRWAAIHYIRAFQRAKHPSTEDVKAAEEQ